MLSFKEFISEEKKERKGAAANANGVRHELMVAGVLNHMSKHHSGGKEPNLFNMSHEELKDHFDNHVKNGKFASEHMPEHYRSADGSPHEVHGKLTGNLSHEDHFNHFRNAVEHAKKLHDHLESRGYDPKTLSNVAWTSQAKDVSHFMKKHTNNPDRQSNPGTDDADLMATIKNKNGETKPLGLSLKWSSSKGKAPTAKNNTVKTVIKHTEVSSPEAKDAVAKYQNAAAASVKEHNDKVSSFYKGSQTAKKNQYDIDRASSDPEAQKRADAVDASYKKRCNDVASHMENALHEIHKGPNGHHEISEFIRRKLQIPNPDFVASRSTMSVDNNDKANGHHFEDHSVSLNDHLNNAHHFHIDRTGATVKIHAKDKDGNTLFTHRLWTKHNSRASDSSTKWLHAADSVKPSTDTH